MYKNIVFDIDGTLINTRKCTKDVYRKLVFDEFGETYSDAQLSKAMSWPTRQVLEILGFQNIPETLNKYHANLMHAYRNVEIYRGAVQTLDILKKRNIMLSVVTARNQSEIDDDSVLGSIRSKFDFIISADDTAKHKPDPEPLLLNFKRTNIKPNETVYIGDAYTDFMCAKNAGIHFGLALWGAETREGIDAQYFLSKPEEILDL